MMRKLAFILVFLIAVSWSSQANAAIPQCAGFSGFTNFIVNCTQTLTFYGIGYQLNADGTVTPLSGNKIQALTVQIRFVVYVILVLAVIIFGFKLASGGVKNPKGESLALLLKLAGVIFLTQFPGVNYVVPFFTTMQKSLSGAFVMTGVGVCDALPNDQLWRRVDCAFASFLSLDAGTATNSAMSFASQNIGLFAVVIALALFTGLGIFVIAMIFIAVLLFLALMATAMFSYLLCFIAVTFLLALLPIVAPTILFARTKPMFSKWLDLTISYTMQPIVIIAYITLSLQVIDSMIFSGTNSIYAMNTELFNDINGNQANWFSMLFGLIRIPTASLNWVQTRLLLYFCNMVAAMVTLALLYAYMNNVTNFANEIAGVGSSTTNLANKFNVLNMAQKAGRSIGRVGKGAVAGAIKGIKGGPKGMLAGSIKGAAAVAAKETVRRGAQGLKGG